MPGQRKWAAEVGRATPPAGSAVPLRLGASRALLPAIRAPGCPQRLDFGQPNWQATLPKNACGAGEPAARYRRLIWGAAEASRRGGVGDGSFVAFEGQPTARGRPYEAVDGVRRLSRPAVGPYHVENVAGIAGEWNSRKKATRSSSGSLFILGCQLVPPLRPPLASNLTF